MTKKRGISNYTSERGINFVNNIILYIILGKINNKKGVSKLKEKKLGFGAFLYALGCFTTCVVKIWKSIAD